jgi:adenylate cyclase
VTPPSVERKLAAILSADVKGFSRLMGEDEEATPRTLTTSRQVTDTLIQQHRGRIVGTAEDSILAEFASVVDAVQCAVEIQTALKTENANLPLNRRMEFRIGINLGDVMVEGEQIYGDGVNIAARLEALAEAGGICISGAVYEQIKNKLALHYEDLGEQALKNIADPVQVWRVVLNIPSPLVGESQGEGATGRTGTTKPPLSTQDSPLRTDAAPVALPLPDKPSIVVLPFVNLSSDPEQEYFSDDITEDITTDLSKIASLFVISRNSAFTYKGKATKAQNISREMGVRYVLEGSVRKAGERIRIRAQLIDATEDRHLWAERYDRPLTDIFAVQDEIRQKIVTVLKVKLTLEEHERFQRAPTNNLEAYDCYLRGWEAFGRALYEVKKELNEQARQMFEKAIELDSKYAGACAGLGFTHWLDFLYLWTEDRAQSLERAFGLLQKAVALDDSLAMPHRALGWVCVWKKQHDQAVAEAERAIALDPNEAEGYVNLGNILVLAGRPEEAIGLIKKAMRLNPRYPVLYLHTLGQAYRVAGQYEEAIIHSKKVLTLNSNFPHAHVNLAACYAELGREEEARAEVAEILRLTPNWSLEFIRQLPYKDPAAVERFLAALRKAGLK